MNNGMPKLIAIIAIERTGTNYFCNLVRQLINMNGMYELFHPEEPFGLSPALWGEIFGVDADRIVSVPKIEMARAVVSDPARVVEGLRRFEKRPSLFKIFPGHIALSKVRDQILLNSAIIKIFIDRSPIDVFISQLKAGKVSKWKNLDTTDIRVSLKRKQIENWYINRKEWYDFCVHILEKSRQDYGYINYEKIDKLSPVDLVGQFIKLVSELGCRLELNNDTIINTMMKQDRGKQASDKVDNWEDFLESFESRDSINKLYDGFLIKPEKYCI